MRDFAFSFAEFQVAYGSLGKDGGLVLVLTHPNPGRGKIAGNIEDFTVDGGVRKILGWKNAGPPLFDLPFLDQAIEDDAFAVIVEHMPLELDEGIMHLMGWDRGCDLIDVGSGQDKPS